QDAGLAFVNRANKLQDQFRSRLMFPIYDSRGEPAGFGGRALGDQMPKYKNSPETPIYQKSRPLYGVNPAQGEIVARGEWVICEGYTDVMAFVLAGAPNAVATCGTALADDHFQILKNVARKVVLAYDADSAGRAAAERWYQWEQTYEVQVEVADLPPGRDPGDLWKEDPTALPAAIERAAPFLQFRLDRLLASADLRTLEGRARAGEAAATIIAAHPNELVRDQYVMKVAGTLEIDADRLRAVVRTGPRRQRERAPRRSSEAGEGTTPRPAPVDRRELDVLRWAIHRPELIVDLLDESLFANPNALTVYQLLEGSPTFQDALDQTEGGPRELMYALGAEPPIANDEEAIVALQSVAVLAEVRARERAPGMDVNAAEANVLMRAVDSLRRSAEDRDWETARSTVQQLVGLAVARNESVEGAE